MVYPRQLSTHCARRPPVRPIHLLLRRNPHRHIDSRRTCFTRIHKRRSERGPILRPPSALNTGNGHTGRIARPSPVVRGMGIDERPNLRFDRDQEERRSLERSGNEILRPIGHVISPLGLCDIPDLRHDRLHKFSRHSEYSCQHSSLATGRQTLWRDSVGLVHRRLRRQDGRGSFPYVDS